MPQVVEMEVRDPDLLTGLSPAECGIEVSAMPRLTVLVDKYQHVRAVERVGVQVVLHAPAPAGTSPSDVSTRGGVSA